MFTPGIAGTPPARTVKDPGNLGVNYVLIQTTGVSDGDTVTIAARVYEFDTDSTFTGDVQVDVTGDTTADAAIVALVAAINGDASRTVEAIVEPSGTNNDTVSACQLVERTAGSGNFSLAVSGANIVLGAATSTMSATPTQRTIMADTYTITSTDVTALGVSKNVPIGGMDGTSAPIILSAHVRNPTTGALIVLTSGTGVFSGQVNSNHWQIMFGDGGGDASAGDVVEYVALVKE